VAKAGRHARQQDEAAAAAFSIARRGAAANFGGRAAAAGHGGQAAAAKRGFERSSVSGRAGAGFVGPSGRRVYSTSAA